MREQHTNNELVDGELIFDSALPEYPADLAPIVKIFRMPDGTLMQVAHSYVTQGDETRVAVSTTQTTEDMLQYFRWRCGCAKNGVRYE